MTGSILDDVKKVLGLDSSYTPFDADVTMHINTVLAVLSDLGLGSDGGMSIADNTVTWTNLFGNDPTINYVKSYTYMRVKMMFDPPQTSFVIDAYRKQIEELEWRINVNREGKWWTDPDPTLEPPVVLPWWETL